MLSAYLIPFVLTFTLSTIITKFVRHWALKHNFVDYPSPRKIHTKPVPRLGGIAVFLSFFLVTLAYLIFASDKLNFVSAKFLGIDKNLFGVLSGGLVIVAAGIYDDIKGLNPGLKFLLQLIAAGLVAGFGIRIWWFSNPFGPHIVLGEWSPVFVVLWVVLMINVVNWLDGLDGLATGISAIAAIVLFFLAIQPTVNQPATSLLCLILAASALGFLPFNFNPAKIFLGDSGAMFFGYMLAIFAIISGGKVATTLLVLGIPIFDVVWVILRRMWYRKLPWLADKRHLHHRFLLAGFNQRQAVLFLYGLSALFGVLALYSDTLGKFRAGLALLGLMVLLAFVLIVLESRRRNAKQST